MSSQVTPPSNRVQGGKMSKKGDDRYRLKGFYNEALAKSARAKERIRRRRRKKKSKSTAAEEKERVQQPKRLSNKAFYASWEWKRLRYSILLERGARCECCGASKDDGVAIVVDHIRPIRRFWELRLDPENCQVLCNDCNMGKGSDDETDWRGDVSDLVEAQITPPEGWLN